MLLSLLLHREPRRAPRVAAFTANNGPGKNGIRVNVDARNRTVFARWMRRTCAALSASFFVLPRNLCWKFTRAAARSLTVENAGGTSELSEALSIDLFERFFGAHSFLYEMEVTYDFYQCSIVDYRCTIGTVRVGVSVTRAMGYPDPSFFHAKDALRLLRKKLYGLIVARRGVTKAHSFYHCVLHVFCQNVRQGKLLAEAFRTIQAQEPESLSKTMIHITVARNCGSWVFYQQ